MRSLKTTSPPSTSCRAGAPGGKPLTSGLTALLTPTRSCAPALLVTAGRHKDRRIAARVAARIGRLIEAPQPAGADGRLPWQADPAGRVVIGDMIARRQTVGPVGVPGEARVLVEKIELPQELGVGSHALSQLQCDQLVVAVEPGGERPVRGVREILLAELEDRPDREVVPQGCRAFEPGSQALKILSLAQPDFGKDRIGLDREAADAVVWRR